MARCICSMLLVNADQARSIADVSRTCWGKSCCGADVPRTQKKTKKMAHRHVIPMRPPRRARCVSVKNTAKSPRVADVVHPHCPDAFVTLDGDRSHPGEGTRV